MSKHRVLGSGKECGINQAPKYQAFTAMCVHAYTVTLVDLEKIRALALPRPQGGL